MLKKSYRVSMDNHFSNVMWVSTQHRYSSIIIIKIQRYSEEYFS